MLMHYTYVEAWSILGITLSDGIQSYKIGHSDCCRYILTHDPDAFLSTIDRGFSIGHFMLCGGGLARLDYDSKALPSMIEKIQAERKNKIMNQAVLIVEIQGDTEVFSIEPSREFNDFIVTLAAIDKDRIDRLIKVHRYDIDAMKVALALESEEPLKFSILSSGVYFTDERNKTIHNIDFSFNGSMFSSRKLTSEDSNRISTRYDYLRQAKDMTRVQRLFSLMTDNKNTPLFAFISGWTALEILINKSFAIYKEVLVNEEESSICKEFISRKNQNKKDADEYTLMDKFILAVLKLFPNDVDDDCEKFSALKKLRNSIHNKEFSEPDLPVSELATLLKKYMHAYMK